jgi:hypothetical protein
MLSHRSLNEVKWKLTTVDPKLQLLLKKNIYLIPLLRTHTTLSNFCPSHAIRQNKESKIISYSRYKGFMDKDYQVFHGP